jgi:hypothetical protein
MGFFSSLFAPKPAASTPTVLTILPDAAISEIERGRLPQLNTNRVFLKKGEKCHYIDKAILMKPKVKRNYAHLGAGFTISGLRINGGIVEPIEQEYFTRINGIIYITNKRTIFQAERNGFDKSHTSLTSIVPYANAVDMQYGSTCLCLIVPNGGLVNKVYDILLK